MPELPEVETIARDLENQVAGVVIDSIEIRLEKLVRTGRERLVELLTGKRLLEARRRGKMIELHFSEDCHLIVHLKMTGQFLWGEEPETWPGHVHAVFRLNDGRTLLYKDIRQFGRFLAMDGGEYRLWLEKLKTGPDPFQMTAEEFAVRLAGRKSRIKPLLLNQAFISGLGNIYVDEALFASGIHPLRGSNTLSAAEATRLFGNILDILEKAIQMRGSTTNNYVGLKGIGGEYQAHHRVYQRTGEPCPECGETVQRCVVGGRGTHFCPVCQAACPENPV